jgi:hypothetical protein
MNAPTFLFAATCLTWITASALAQAQETSLTPTAEVAAEDSELPQPFDPGTLNALIENPPFTRTVNPSDSLVLSGLAFIDGKPVATLFDSDTKSSIIVSEQPNVKGWTLSEAVGTGDIRSAQAKVSIGGEIVSIRYNKDALTPDKLKKQKSGDPRGGPPPGGPPPGSGGYERSGPRPSQEDIERYRSLSDKARDKLREEFTKNRERLMNATPEERSAFMRSTFERVQREDSGGGGGNRAPSSGGDGRSRGDGRGPGR